jgi:hypothetical protein
MNRARRHFSPGSIDHRHDDWGVGAALERLAA